MTTRAPTELAKNANLPTMLPREFDKRRDLSGLRPSTQVGYGESSKTPTNLTVLEAMHHICDTEEVRAILTDPDAAELVALLGGLSARQRKQLVTLARSMREE